MGSLRYGGEVFDFEDRLLAHLQVAIGTKLRRRESFFLSWTMPLATGSGRHAVWIDPAVALDFLYLGNRVPSINRLCVEELVAAANSSGGMTVTEEPDERFHGERSPGGGHGRNTGQ